MPYTWPEVAQIVAGAVLIVTTPIVAVAQDRSAVELQTDHQSLNAGYGTQSGVLLRAVVDRGKRSAWTVDIAARRAFGDDGLNLGVLQVGETGAGLIAAAGVSTSLGGFFLPRFRADLSLGKKLGDRKDLIAAATTRFVQAKDGHRDAAIGGEMTWYTGPLVVQAGTVLNFSMPGGVQSVYSRGAVTFRSSEMESVVIHGAVGREAYQPLTPDAGIVGFRSGSFGATWRRWVSGGWGASAGAEVYENVAYHRFGVTVGVMRQIPGRLP